MKKTILALAAVAAIAAGTLTVPAPAEARCTGCWIGGAAVGGLLLGGAIAAGQPRYYAPEPGYVVYQGYAEPYPVGCPGGYWARRPLRDGYGNFVGYSRPRFICP